MLKHLDPLLNADVLHALASMGHGDDLIVCDSNFPADSVARDTSYGQLLRIDADAPTAIRALLSLFPLDPAVAMGEAAARMEVMGNPTEVLPVAKEVQAEVDLAEGKSWPMGSIERFAFYEHAKRAFCVVQTRERRFYGCFKFKMGVIPPEAKLGT
jgi:L-fucose mutarotase